MAVADGTEVRLYESRDLVLLHSFAADYAEALAFDADGNLLAVGGRDGSVRVWAVSDGGERAFLLGTKAGLRVWPSAQLVIWRRSVRMVGW